MNERLRLTEAQIKALPLPESGRSIYYDTETPGLGLRLFSTGRAVWFWLGRHKGRTVRETLGTCRQTEEGKLLIGPARARTLAKQAAASVYVGIRPTEEKRKEREEVQAAPTLGAVFKEYAEHKPVRSPRTRDSEWRCYLKRWESRRLDKLDRGTVRSWFRDLTKDTSPSTANKALARLKALYSWARVEMDYEGPDPTLGITKHAEKGSRRKRRLKSDELKSFFAALDRATTRDMADLFRLALFTGQRSGNVKAMRWADLDLTGHVWTIPQTKQGEAAEVALAPPVVELLEARRILLAERVRKAKKRAEARAKARGQTVDPDAWPKPSPFVFPARSRSGHLETYRKAWLDVCEEAGIRGLRVHDLRRSLASFAQDSGIGTAIVAAQLGHADAATTLRHYTSIAGKAQQEAIAAVVAGLLEGGRGSE